MKCSVLLAALCCAAVSFTVLSTLAPSALASPRQAQANFSAAPPSSFPQTGVTLAPAEAANFHDAFAGVAKQAHVVFVAQGLPFVPTLPMDGKEFPVVKNLPAAQAIDVLARAYDLLPMYDKSGEVVVLRKRYSDREDLPNVTMEECSEAGQKIDRAFALFTPRVKPKPGYDADGGLVLDFFATLTPEQMQALQNKTLRAVSLSAKQQELVHRDIDHLTIDSSRVSVVGSLVAYRAMPQGYLTRSYLGAQKLMAITPLTLAPNKGTWEQTYYLNLNQFHSSTPASGYVSRAADRAKAVEPLADLPNCQTLEKAVARLPKTIGQAITVDAQYAHRTVFVIDDPATPRGVTPRQMASALAQASDLTLISPEEGVFRITQRHVKANTSAELGSEVYSLLPAVMLRAASGADSLSNDQMKGDTFAQGMQARKRRSEEDAAQLEKFLFHRAQSSRLESYCAEASAVLEAALDKAENALPPPADPKNTQPPRITLSQLSDTEKQALSVLLLARGTQSFWKSPISFETPPRCVRDYDQMFITGGPYRGKSGESFVALEFSFKQPDGTMHSETGFYEVPWNPSKEKP